MSYYSPVYGYRISRGEFEGECESVVSRCTAGAFDGLDIDWAPLYDYLEGEIDEEEIVKYARSEDDLLDFWFEQEEG